MSDAGLALPPACGSISDQTAAFAAGLIPAIDESVSRHMGLFAVARLAERHGVRVRLRAGTPY